MEFHILYKGYHKMPNPYKLEPCWVHCTFTQLCGVQQVTLDWNHKSAVRTFAAHADYTLRNGGEVITKRVKN